MPLNESPSEKEGKFDGELKPGDYLLVPSMKVPPKRKGNGLCLEMHPGIVEPSMKVPPKRKGNYTLSLATVIPSYSPQ